MSEGKTPQNRLNRALAEWPTKERTALEWDESASAVMARLEAGQSGETRIEALAGKDVSDEDLLAPPLPAEGFEMTGSASTSRGDGGMQTSTRERDRSQFKDLAKMADEGRISRPPSGEMRAAEEPVSDRGEAPASGEREENSGLIHLASLQAAANETAASAEVAAAAKPEATTSATTRSKDGKDAGRWGFFGAGLVAAAAAAAVVFGMRTGHAPSVAPVAIAPQAVPVTPPGSPATTSAAPSPIAQADKGVDPSTLPPADNGTHPVPAPAPTAAKMAGGGTPVAQAQATPTPPPAPDPQTVASAAAPAASAASLADLMQQAAGVTPASGNTSPTPGNDSPQAAPGSVPLKPSLGAIQGAIGAAMPAARGCLGPDDPISRAMVTFQSDGSVQSVSISGGAAGKPAEACIRNALMKARVAPFAQPTFSAPATIRGG